jgi:hypothetical protein
MDLLDTIRSALPKFLGGLSKEEAAARANQRKATRDELDNKAKARESERKEIAA